METTKTSQQSILTFAVKTSPHYTLISACYGGVTLDGRSPHPPSCKRKQTRTRGRGRGSLNCITLSDQMQLEAKSILQVLGRWSRRPDFSRLRQLRHADTTPDSLRILDLQIYSLNWLSYGPRAWPLFNQMPPPPPNKSQTPVRTHSYHLITLILHRSLLFFLFFLFFLST